MSYQVTTALKKILALNKRLKIIQGGTSAGKTIAILMILIDIAQSNQNKIISVVSESVPHLKRASIRDFLAIMESKDEKGRCYYRDDKWNRTDFIYTFETGSRIEFFSADTPDKVRGPRRDILFINECNNISYETYTQLAIRTNGDIYLDYNPTSEFWVHEDILNKAENDFIILNYKDNEALPDTIVKEIESRKENRRFWKVFGLGELGESEGKIYRDWQVVDELPHEARLERYGLDFGYSNDPTVIVAIYKYNGGFIFDEITYQKGLSNKQIADILLNQEQALVIADSAEPKSIDEIKSYGVNILPAIKGQGSVNQGIQFVQEQRCSMTKRSLNVIKSSRNYMWMKDKEGRLTQNPDHLWSDPMDAIRYGLSSYEPMDDNLRGQIEENRNTILSKMRDAGY